jgi:hypothetical protein
MSTTPPPSGGPSPPRPGSTGHIMLTMIVTAILAVGVTIAVTPGEPSPSNPKPSRRSPSRSAARRCDGAGPAARSTRSPSTRTGQKIVAAQKAEDAAGDTVGLGVQPPRERSCPHRRREAKANKHPAARSARSSRARPARRRLAARMHHERSSATSHRATAPRSTSGSSTGPAHRSPPGRRVASRSSTGSTLPAAQASSDYVTDQAGRCWYTVPETQKAWTQAAANPWSVSVEIVNPGVLPLFRTAAAKQAVVRLMIGWHHRWHIPYQHGAVNSRTACRSSRASSLTATAARARAATPTWGSRAPSMTSSPRRRRRTRLASR